MKKTCPHCGIDFMIDFATAKSSPKWAFARCFECHGLTLIDSRRNASGALDFPSLPSFLRKPKPKAKLEAVEAEGPKITVTSPPAAETPIQAAPAPTVPIPAPILSPGLSKLPEPLPELDALAGVSTTPAKASSSRFYIRQAAIVGIFVTSVVALRWALIPHSNEAATDAIPQGAHEIHDAVNIAKAAPVAPAVPVAAAPPAAAPANVAQAVAAGAPLLKALQVEVEVTASNATLRKGPGTQYAKVASARAQTQLAVRKKQGDWLEVELESGGTAWVRNDLVRVL